MSVVAFKYTTADNVKVRLTSKVQFQSAAEPYQGELPDALLAQIIKRAEMKVELDLRSRYAIPFREQVTNEWKDLPIHTRDAITEAVDLKAVRMILETDFGSGTGADADKYASSVKKAYGDHVKSLLGFNPESEERDPKRFRFAPPLEGLLLAGSNQHADDGYKGMIINTDQANHDSASYAADQINNPARSFRNRPWGSTY